MSTYDDRADAHLDADLDALARQEAPPQHVARVLARTVAAAHDAAVTRPSTLLVRLARPQWVLPVAATGILAFGALWRAERTPVTLPEVLHADGPAGGAYRGRAWGAVDDIVRPVLPPQAYWGMDAFAEFRTLRPGVTGQAARSVRRGAHPDLATGLADDELAWPSDASPLPEIRLSSIVPAPLVIAPLEAPPAITLTEIALEPIELVSLDQEEKP